VEEVVIDVILAARGQFAGPLIAPKTSWRRGFNHHVWFASSHDDWPETSATTFGR
jgi:hypothetical protein